MDEYERKGLRVTSESIKNRIIEVDYKTIDLAGVRFMFCGIKMKGGFVVTSTPSACIDIENWRDEIAKKVSYENAFGELARLEAYRLMSENDEI